MKKALAFLTENWLWILIVLIVLWALPRITNFIYVVASAFFELGNRIDRKIDQAADGARAILAPVSAAVKGIAAGAAKVAEFSHQNPWSLWIAPVLLHKKFPKFSLALSVWALLDYFKGDETVTVTRGTTPVTGREGEFLPATEIGSPFR